MQVSMDRNVKELIVGKYSTCLGILREVVSEEKAGGFGSFEILDPDRWLKDGGNGESDDSSSS